MKKEAAPRPAAPKKKQTRSNVMYTNAPADVAFNAACSALKNLGYTIEEEDAKNFFVKAYYARSAKDKDRRYAEIKVSREASCTKIASSAQRSTVTRAFGLMSYSRPDAVYKEISKVLVSNEVGFRKINEARREREREALEASKVGMNQE
jgi:hypothetical protein